MRMRTFATTAATGLTSTPLWAHPHHDGTDPFWHNVVHIASSPDHLLMLAVVTAAVALAWIGAARLWRRVRRRRHAAARLRADTAR